MSENSTPFEGENLASYEALKTAIQLADGFTLIFAVTNTEAGAQEVMRRLWGDGVRYQKAWLRDPERPLVDQVLEGLRSAKQPVMVLGLEGLTTMRETIGYSLRNLNWTRPQWAARMPQAIIFWVIADMEAILAREAPDLWRFRSLRVEFEFPLLPAATRALDLRKRLRTLKLSPHIRLRSLIELFNLTRDQRPLEEAVRLVGGQPELSVPEEFVYLKRLKMHGADHATVEGLGPFPNLQSIELEFTLDDDETVAELLEESRPTNLRSAIFLEGLIGDMTISALSSLPNFSHLQWTSETRRDFAGEKLIRLKSLKSLALYMPEMTQRDFQYICEMRRLSMLSFALTPVSDEEVHHLQSLQKLWQLEIMDSGLTSRSLPSIAKLSELRSLNLTANHISDKNLLELANLPKIRSIDLSINNVTRRGVSNLKALFSAQNRKVEIFV